MKENVDAQPLGRKKIVDRGQERKARREHIARLLLGYRHLGVRAEGRNLPCNPTQEKTGRTWERAHGKGVCPFLHAYSTPSLGPSAISPALHPPSLPGVLTHVLSPTCQDTAISWADLQLSERTWCWLQMSFSPTPYTGVELRQEIFQVSTHSSNHWTASLLGNTKDQFCDIPPPPYIVLHKHVITAQPFLHIIIHSFNK